MMKTLLKKLLIITVLIGSVQLFAQEESTITSDATHINLVGDLLKSDGSGGYVGATTILKGVAQTVPANCGLSIKTSSGPVFYRNYKSNPAKAFGPSLVEDDTPAVGWTTLTWDDATEINNIPLSTNAGAIPPVVGDVLNWFFKVEVESVISNLTVVDFTLGVEDVDLKDDINIVLYPNPAQNTLQINAPNSIDSIEIFNLLGQKVMEQKGSKAINVRSLSKGNYIVKIVQENETVSTKRFIKK